MVLRTLRVPFNMETILMVIFTVIIVDASVREKPIQILRTLATAGLIREYQLEDRKSGCTNYFPDSNCKRWKTAGYCETSRVFREKNCPKSCGFCAVCNNNQAQDNGETGIDCGGGICPACPPDSCATRDKTSRCDQIGTRFTCLTSTESRPHWPSSPCGWCPDGPCTGDNANRCEPSKWLEDKKKSGFETCYTKCKVGGRFDLVDGTTKGNCNDNELCIANGQCKVCINDINNDVCDIWANQGYCVGFAKEYCRKSCGLCE